MAAYYNEIDPYAAQWLRNLVDNGLIAPGDVDERSVEDVRPDDLRGYAQCHFFAGVGVWSLALRQAGWNDDQPVWTGSCPCQPFSAAGKGAGFDDERHLWPAFHHLIRECGPSVVFGEQVASKDGLNWLDLVQSDLEASSYAFGAADTCAAGFGAPHIRQRLYWVADADDKGLEGRVAVRQRSGQRPLRPSGVAGGLADHGSGRRPLALQHDGGGRAPRGFWRDADWLFCRDGKWRPVEPGTSPLAHGAPTRVGRLRAYGNAINAAQAQGFIEAAMELL